MRQLVQRIEEINAILDISKNEDYLKEFCEDKFPPLHLFWESIVLLTKNEISGII